MKVIKQILAITAMLFVITPAISASPLQNKDEKQQPKEPKVVKKEPKPDDPPRDKNPPKKDSKEGKKP